MKILDIAAYYLLVVFGFMFALIGILAFFLLMITGEWLNILGVISGFVLAWIIWEVVR